MNFIFVYNQNLRISFKIKYPFLLKFLTQLLITGYPATKLLLKPITGRRHQLRVHLSESGHTIVGDFTYSNRRDLYPYRMFLHAIRLIFPSEYEHVDVRTKDPFTESDRKNKWTPIETLNELNDDTYLKLKLGKKWYKRWCNCLYYEDIYILMCVYIAFSNYIWLVWTGKIIHNLEWLSTFPIFWCLCNELDKVPIICCIRVYILSC